MLVTIRLLQCTGMPIKTQICFQTKHITWEFFYLLVIFFKSYEMIADGEEHTIELLAIKKNFTMRVDRGKARSIINDGDRDMLKLTTPLYVGGLPPSVASTALNQWHLRNSTSFHGL